MTLTSNDGESTGFARTRFEKLRQRIREDIRNKVYPEILAQPLIARPSKDISFFRNFSEDMSQVPLVVIEGSSVEINVWNPVNQRVGPPHDTWMHCIEREPLVERSSTSNDLPAALEHIGKLDFDNLLRHLHNELINFQTVSTARAALDVAHQYRCPKLARLAEEFLQKNLNSNNVLEIYRGLSLYADHHTVSHLSRSSTLPTAPPPPGDVISEIAETFSRVLLACLDVIDSDPTTILSHEYFEELTAQEILQFACRDTLRLTNEFILFSALDKRAESGCRKLKVRPTPSNKRAALPDEVWFSVRYPLMTVAEFEEGPMSYGILSNEESEFIIRRIHGSPQNCEREDFRNSINGSSWRISSTPRMGVRTYEDQDSSMLKPGKQERQDNRKNRRKECATQRQKACERIGDCILRAFACIFD